MSDNNEPEGQKCSGNCDTCSYKYFDSMENYEFICELDGHEVFQL